MKVTIEGTKYKTDDQQEGREIELQNHSLTVELRGEDIVISVDDVTKQTTVVKYEKLKRALQLLEADDVK